MSCSNRHIAMEVGQHDVASFVDVTPLKIHNPALSVFSPINPSAFVVELIGRGVHIAKVAQPVIKRVAVDVVDNVRLLVVRNKPSNSVSKIALSFNTNYAVSGGAFCRSSYRASTSISAPYFICDNPRFRVIDKAFTDRIWDNFVSHVKLLLDLVRGSVVRATDTSIIPIVSTIGIIFAPSGGKSRGAYGTPPCSIFRHPF